MTMMPKVGDVDTGIVIRVHSTYAIMLFDEGYTGLLHISELSNSFIRSFTSFVTVGSIYAVKVIAVDEEKHNVRVSLKAMTPSDKAKAFHHSRINPSDISFAALADHLSAWIDEENEQGASNI